MTHRLLVAACLGAAVLAAACGGSAEPPAPQQAPAFKAIDPATMPGPEAGAPLGAPPSLAAPGDLPAAMVTDLASGWPIALRVGQRMTARLAGDRAGDARWSMRAGSDGGVVALEGEPAFEQGPQGAVEVFRLTAVKPGRTTLTFDHRKGSDPAPLRSVSYPVTVE